MLMARKPSSAQLGRKQYRREASLRKWRALDWSKTNVELAEEMGYRHSSPICHARRLIGAPQSPRWHKYRASLVNKRKRLFLTKWRRLDWSKQDIELAQKTGLSRERIRQIRKSLGASKSPQHNRKLAPLRKTKLLLEWVKTNLNRFKGMSRAEVARKYGMGTTTRICSILRAEGVLQDGRQFRLYRWDLMNFDLPGRTLEQIWKVPLYRATQYRCLHRLPKAKWKLGRGMTMPRMRQELPAYNRAVREEETRAVEWFKSHKQC